MRFFCQWNDEYVFIIVLKQNRLSITFKWFSEYINIFKFCFAFPSIFVPANKQLLVSKLYTTYKMENALFSSSEKKIIHDDKSSCCQNFLRWKMTHLQLKINDVEIIGKRKIWWFFMDIKAIHINFFCMLT